MLGERLRRASSMLHRVPKPLLLTLGVALVALVATADELLGQNASLAMLYVVPIALVTWYNGGGWGLLFATFAGLLDSFLAYTWLPKGSATWVVAWCFAARLISFSLSAGLIWCLHRALENQRALANTDHMTGIANTRAFRMAAARELARCARGGAPLSAIYLDCDNFKAVNDRHGHAGGDRLLRAVARTLTANLRLTDHVARLGGDEFALLLPDAGPADAGPLVAKLHELLLAEMVRNNWPVTFSIGVATFISPAGSVDELLSRVDGLQYQAKSTGKNKIVHELVTGPVRLAA